MASSNLELVWSIYAEWERGDFSSAEWAHQEIEFVQADGPDPGRWTGVAAMANAFRGRLSTLHEFRAVADEYRVLDEERVLVIHHRIGRGKTSGVDIGRMGSGGANVFYVRDGRVARLINYVDRDRALADLGLAPQAGATGS
jgi:ketosteroid isomerase-like protein